jgi:hypothetical protein
MLTLRSFAFFSCPFLPTFAKEKKAYSLSRLTEGTHVESNDDEDEEEEEEEE